ncbi:MAG: class I SAM-dependent methyltransferase [Parachlamydiales bacterium]|nr:class I SAM-dependent methyltransferase [Parachlamydiales bacterium]
MPIENLVSESKIQKVITAGWASIRHPNLFYKALKDAIHFLHASKKLSTSNIIRVPVTHLIKEFKQINLFNPYTRDGGTTYLELIAICSLLIQNNPKNLLEIGTFEGSTTLQLAINSDDDAEIHTLDLPSDTSNTIKPTLATDLQFINDIAKTNRKYLSHSTSKKVIQHLGDSANYDFKTFVKNKPLDFAFIDGGHSYECVKNDTEKVLAILNQSGVILWHDFNPTYQGVYRYLNELSKTLKLYHLKDTTLVYYKKT